LTEDEVEKAVIDVIESSEAKSIKDMGVVMGILKPMLVGKANMADVSKKIKAKLT
jgi:uncharacterized protein YqeY